MGQTSRLLLRPTWRSRKGFTDDRSDSRERDGTGTGQILVARLGWGKIRADTFIASVGKRFVGEIAAMKNEAGTTRLIAIMGEVADEEAKKKKD